MDRDKLLHFIVCETLVMVLSIVGRFIGLGNYAYLAGFLIALIAGVGKELHDKKTTGFDRMDLAADFLGAFAGLVLVFLAGV